MSELELRVLGPTHLRVGGTDISLPPGRAAVLAALAFTRDSLVAIDDLCALIWQDPPATARKALQNQVRRIRATCHPALIETISGTYRLGPTVALVDVDRFAEMNPFDERDADTLTQGLALFRGNAFVELAPTAAVAARRSDLARQRADLIDVLVSLPDSAITADMATSLLDPSDLGSASDTGAVPAERPVVLSRGQAMVAHKLRSALETPNESTIQQTLILGGLAGSGKTTIANQVTSEVSPSVLLLKASCSQSPAAAHEVVIALLDQLPAAVPVDSQLRPVSRLVEALRVIDANVVVVIEDCHWATIAFFDLVEQLGQQAPAVKLLLVTRDQAALEDALTNGSCALLLAPPLDHEAVETLISSTVGSNASSSDVAAEIHVLTGGHPLFAAEIVRELQSARAFIMQDDTLALRPGHRVPSSLTEAVSQQLISLPLRSRHFVEMVATLHLIGGSTTTAAEDAAASADGLRVGLLQHEDEGRWGMHAEVALAIRDTLSRGARAELHAQAAELLRERWPVAAVRHAMHAGNLPSRYLQALTVEAAHHARSLQDFPSALEMWDLHDRVADPAVSPTGDVVDHAMQRCDAARRCGDERQVGYMRDLVRLALEFGSHDQLAETAKIVCQLGAATGVAPEAEFVAFAEHTLGLDLTPTQRATVLSATTQLYVFTDVQRARSRFDEAYRLAVEIGDSELLRFVLPAVHVTVVGPTDLELRTNVAERLLELSVEANDPGAEWEAHHTLFSCALIRGDLQLVRHHTEAAADLPPTRYELLRAGTVAYMRSAERHLAGDLERAERYADEHLGHAHTIGAERAIATYSALILAIRYDQGRLGELIPAVENLIETQPHIVGWKGVLAWAVAESGDVARGRDLLQSLLDDGLDLIPRTIGHTAVVWCCGTAAVLIGDQELGAVLSETLLPYEHTLSWSGSSTLGPIDLVLGGLAALAGRTSEARSYFDAVNQTGRKNDWPAVELRTQLAIASLDPTSIESQQSMKTVFARALQLGFDGVAYQARALLGG